MKTWKPQMLFQFSILLTILHNQQLCLSKSQVKSNYFQLNISKSLVNGFNVISAVILQVTVFFFWAPLGQGKNLNNEQNVPLVICWKIVWFSSISAFSFKNKSYTLIWTLCWAHRASTKDQNNTKKTMRVFFMTSNEFDVLKILLL